MVDKEHPLGLALSFHCHEGSQYEQSQFRDDDRFLGLIILHII